MLRRPRNLPQPSIKSSRGNGLQHRAGTQPVDRRMCVWEPADDAVLPIPLSNRPAIKHKHVSLSRPDRTVECSRELSLAHAHTATAAPRRLYRVRRVQTCVKSAFNTLASYRLLIEWVFISEFIVTLTIAVTGGSFERGINVSWLRYYCECW